MQCCEYQNLMLWFQIEHDVLISTNFHNSIYNVWDICDSDSDSVCSMFLYLSSSTLVYVFLFIFYQFLEKKDEKCSDNWRVKDHWRQLCSQQATLNSNWTGHQWKPIYQKKNKKKKKWAQIEPLITTLFSLSISIVVRRQFSFRFTLNAQQLFKIIFIPFYLWFVQIAFYFLFSIIYFDWRSKLVIFYVNENKATQSKTREKS